MSLHSVEAQHKPESSKLLKLQNSFEAGVLLPDQKIKLERGFILTLLCKIKASSGNVNETRDVIENKTNNSLFLTSVSESKTRTRLTLHRMKCSASVNDFHIPRLRRGKSLNRQSSAMTVNKYRSHSIAGLFKIDLTYPFAFQARLCVALMRLTNPRKYSYAPERASE